MTASHILSISERVRWAKAATPRARCALVPRPLPTLHCAVMGGRVRVERDDRDPRLGWIVFDHPERRNAISVEMWREIPLAVEQLAEDATIRVVLLRGAGDAAFVAGADISEFGEKRSRAS